MRTTTGDWEKRHLIQDNHIWTIFVNIICQQIFESTDLYTTAGDWEKRCAATEERHLIQDDHIWILNIKYWILCFESNICCICDWEKRCAATEERHLPNVLLQVYKNKTKKGICVLFSSTKYFRIQYISERGQRITIEKCNTLCQNKNQDENCAPWN